ncbi:hypothetical protein HW532_02765 [Kaustia mangrovi]|uniref:Uncharacterized protein n=1 Tax=Kaustia mangrovi TaxID=2593653 RepID=A0A7S8HAM9_9HYPH|nr:hypothetical protein HW532_02765 [Kaustia mangrovi]
MRSAEPARPLSFAILLEEVDNPGGGFESMICGLGHSGEEEIKPRPVVQGYATLQPERQDVNPRQILS